MATVFISYNRKSEAVTKALADDVEALGHEVWFDHEISGGQSWWDQILDKIRQSDVFVFVLDIEALNSTACKREYGYAAELGKPILPILASSSVSTNLLPTALSKIQFVDYRKSDREAAFCLARAFTTIPPAAQLPDPMPTPPEVPVSYLNKIADQIESTSSLSYEQQSTLLLDIKRCLRNPETTIDGQTLIKRLRERQDLLAIIAKELDELIGEADHTVNEEVEIKDSSSRVSTADEKIIVYKEKSQAEIDKKRQEGSTFHNPTIEEQVKPTISMNTIDDPSKERNKASSFKNKAPITLALVGACIFFVFVVVLIWNLYRWPLKDCVAVAAWLTPFFGGSAYLVAKLYFKNKWKKS